jgi:hypothetical protein
MKKIVIALSGLAVLISASAGTTAAAPPGTTPPGKLSKFLYRVYGSIAVPPEWAGVWTITDSTYDCNRVFQDVTVETDTICTGMLVYDEPPKGAEIDVQCTGTADGDEVHVVCTGSGMVDVCTVDYTFTTDGVRTGDSYSVETKIEIIASGPSDPCDFFPDMCEINRSHGVRIAPEPTAWCATPAEMSTWGQVKSRYR